MKHSSNFSKKPRSAGPYKSRGSSGPASRPNSRPVRSSRSSFGDRSNDPASRSNDRAAGPFRGTVQGTTRGPVRGPASRPGTFGRPSAPARFASPSAPAQYSSSTRTSPARTSSAPYPARRPSSANTRYPIAPSQNPRYSTPSYSAPRYSAPNSKPSIAPTIPKTPKDDGLVRINKFVAEKFAITRREADKFIEDGFVHIESVNPEKKIGGKSISSKTVDGAAKTSRRRHAKVGDRINPKTETVILNQKKVIDHKSKYMYFVYNKPVGIVTHSPTGDELDIKGLLLKEASIAPHITKDLFPIGRLDKKSQGLIILTNDGRMSDLMLNPAYEHEKEYVVTTAQDLPSYFKKSMEKGVNIGDYVTKPCKIELRGTKTFAITITEGKKHQIRRMCEAMKTDVRTLERTRIMNLKLGSLRSNDLRKIEGRELDLFLKQLVH